MGAKRENKNVLEIARYYEDAFLNDLKKLNIKPATTVARATEHIKDMINLIKVLQEKGYTYTANKNVYFSIDKFSDYNKLANLNIKELQAGCRVEVDDFKKNPLDFVLWFVNSKYDNHILQWDSPWGVGFPGWHIECSAMAIKYLGQYLDIHCGGVDHIPVHHTNEIAQSEGALGHKWVNYWMHGEFLILDNGKMSKSSDKFLTLDMLIEKGFTPLVYRYYVLQSKYRKPLVFSYERLEDAKKSLASLRQKISLIISDIEGSEKSDDYIINNYKEKFKLNINNDLNISNGFTVLFDIIKDNELRNIDKKILIEDFDKVFGLNLTDIVKENSIKEETSIWIEELLQERNKARKNKDWESSDKIRNLLLEKNIEILDTREGTKWKIKD